MDQIWLASPSPALRLWPGAAGATWRLNPAAMTWARQRQLNEASWRTIAAGLGRALASSPAREGALGDPALRWRALPMNTGWLVWLMPEETMPGVPPLPRASAAELLDLLRTSGRVGLFECDLRTGVTHWDAHHFQLFGFDAAEGVPSPDRVLARVHPDDRERLEAECRRFAQTPGRHVIDYRLAGADHSEQAMQSWLEVHPDADGRPAWIVGIGIGIDQSERAGRGRAPGETGAAADFASRQKRVAQRASAVQSEFLARMSHELRTPLNAVLGFAQLIEHDGCAVPATLQLERVAHIRDAGEQLLRLVGDVLEHLRPEVSADDEAVTVPSALEGDGADAFDAGAALSVLYIEDNPVNVILVEELVAMRPNTLLRCAVTGLEGVAMAATAAPHVVLVDMHLPDIDGFEVLRRLRADRTLDRSAVIALSANGMGEDIALALASGFDDYWTKPIDFRHFLDGLDSLARTR